MRSPHFDVFSIYLPRLDSFILMLVFVFPWHLPSWDNYVWEQHHCVQVCPRPALFRYWRWRWKWSYLSLSSPGILWCCWYSTQVTTIVFIFSFEDLHWLHSVSSTICCILLPGTMLIRGRHLKIWISFCYASMKLLMAGRHLLIFPHWSQKSIINGSLSVKVPYKIHKLTLSEQISHVKNTKFWWYFRDTSFYPRVALFWKLMQIALQVKLQVITLILEHLYLSRYVVNWFPR